MNRIPPLLIAKLYSSMADKLILQEDKLLEILTEIETYKTAKNEFDKTIKMLKSYDTEIPYLKNKTGIGRVAIFLPFNMPFYSAVLYAFGPLLSGNEVILRPSSLTKNCFLKIYGIIRPLLSTLPFEVFTGSGQAFLDSIFLSNPVDAVVFTGKWESVQNIKTKIVNNLRLIYCGSGMCPLIVRRDANISDAVKIAISSRVFNSGQDCLATENIFVHNTISNEFFTELKKAAFELRIGNNKDKDVDVGPLVSNELVENIQKLINESEGECILCGKIEGNLVYPYIYKVKKNDSLFLNEKFAPIFTVIEYANDIELLAMINQSNYSLGATVCGVEFAKGLVKIPHISYNKSIIEFEEEDAHIPFGGGKRSGFILEDGKIIEKPILFSEVTTK